jgi:hypothetical protein
MARKKSKRKPPKRDTWKPTPLAPVPRTEEELRAHAQWQAHKRELEAERRQARDARERDFRTALQDYIRAAGLRAALQHDEIRVGDGYPLRLSRGELQRANAGLVFDRLVATKFRRVLLDRVVEHLSGIEPPLQARSSAEGVRLMRSGVTEAVVAASRAMVDGYLEPLLGNYVANGDHWQAL